MALESLSSDPMKEDQKPLDGDNDLFSATTPISESASCGLEENDQVEPEAVVNAETGEEESEVENIPERCTAVNDGLLAIHSDKQSAVVQEEESNDSDASMGPLTVTVSVEEGPSEIRYGESTPSSKHPQLGEVGKQEPLPDDPATPVKDTSCPSSAASTPLGKLIIPGIEGSTAESSSTGAGDVNEESSTPSPRTPRQEEQSPRMAEEYLQFWLVMRIFDNEVTIFFHQRYFTEIICQILKNNQHL